MATAFVSVMNNTKWREALGVIRDLRLRCRIQWRDVAEPTRWQWVWLETDQHIEGAQFTPALLSDIEWLEIETVSSVCNGRLLPERVIDRTGEVTKLLRAIHIPHTMAGSVVRITGYQKLAGGL